MRIVYVGLKEMKADNVAGTGLTWKRGEVQEVADEKKAAKLLEHPLIWKNADEAFELLEEPKVVPAEPRVSLIPKEARQNYTEPIIIPVPAEVFDRVQQKELIAVFMTIQEADQFSEWKDQKDNTAPANTGPRVDKRTREYKQGLEKRA